MSQFNSQQASPIAPQVNVMNPTGIDPNVSMGQIADLSNRRLQKSVSDQQMALERDQMGQQQRQFDASQQMQSAQMKQNEQMQAAQMKQNEEMNRIALATTWKMKRLELLEKKYTQGWGAANSAGNLQEAERLRVEISNNRATKNALSTKLATMAAFQSNVGKNLNPNDPESAVNKAILGKAAEKAQSYLGVLNNSSRNVMKTMTSARVSNRNVMEDPNNPGNFFVMSDEGKWYLPRDTSELPEDFNPLVSMSSLSDLDKFSPVTKEGERYVAMIKNEGLGGRERAARFLQGKFPEITARYVLTRDETTGSVSTRPALVDKNGRTHVFLGPPEAASRDASAIGQVLTGDMPGWRTSYMNREEATASGLLKDEDFTPDFDELASNLHEFLVDGRKYDGKVLDPNILSDIVKNMYLFSTNKNNDSVRVDLTKNMGAYMDAIKLRLGGNQAEFDAIMKDMGIFFNLVQKNATTGGSVQAAINKERMAAGEVPVNITTEAFPGASEKKRVLRIFENMVDDAKTGNLFGDGSPFEQGLIEFEDGVIPDLPETKIAFAVLQQLSGASDNIDLLRKMQSGDLPPNVKELMNQMPPDQQEFMTNLLKNVVVSGITEQGKSLDFLSDPSVMSRDQIMKEIESLDAKMADTEAQTFMKTRPQIPDLMPEFDAMYNEFLPDNNL